ncbi:hypothetical protein VSR01_31655 [Actinacidiphila sp. DG2A-62]|uniref:hypothetical protein n=1 Tax=Actinacidiphila sp. DG2A-62 TaxID=3108821 RepID=UPI002DB9942A|nr:hypothetical protein [Actinacidiphila sp. DG2A-62]MEC3997803.1 hypothetical protein [Actinacidiphila sp. DG2A-62]
MHGQDGAQIRVQPLAVGRGQLLEGGQRQFERPGRVGTPGGAGWTGSTLRRASRNSSSTCGALQPQRAAASAAEIRSSRSATDSAVRSRWMRSATVRRSSSDSAATAAALRGPGAVAPGAEPGGAPGRTRGSAAPAAPAADSARSSARAARASARLSARGRNGATVPPRAIRGKSYPRRAAHHGPTGGTIAAPFRPPAPPTDRVIADRNRPQRPLP